MISIPDLVNKNECFYIQHLYIKAFFKIVEDQHLQSLISNSEVLLDKEEDRNVYKFYSSRMSQIIEILKKVKIPFFIGQEEKTSENL